MAFHVPHQLRKHKGLIALAFQFDGITQQSMPKMIERVAAKEALIKQMAAIIVKWDIPLILAFVAPDHGLKAAFLRAIGETGDPNLLGAIEKIASDTKPVITDLNLKWQIARAYRALNLRFRDDQDVVDSARSIVPFLTRGADFPLTQGIAAMRRELKA